MGINELSYLGLAISLVGIVLAVVSAVLAYRNMKKSDLGSKYSVYTQTALTNSDISISQAVKYLKIVNASEDMELQDD